jgi:hypothetical protein
MSDKLKTCVVCGNEISAGEKTCSHCGAPKPSANKASKKLVPCKSCANEVYIAAKACPHCQAKYPGHGKNLRPFQIGCLSVIGFFVLLAILGSLVEDSSKSTENAVNVDVSQTKPYETILKEDNSVSNRSHLSWSIISPEADTFEERAHTVMNAAMCLQSTTGCDVATVWLEASPMLAGKGFLLAKATYAADGKGYEGDEDSYRWRWQVAAFAKKVEPTSIQVAELWHTYRGDYLQEDGSLDEGGLKSFIAKDLNIAPTAVRLPLFTLDEHVVSNQ